MKDIRQYFLLFLMSAGVLLLTACGGELSEEGTNEDTEGTENGESDTELFDYEDFPQTVSNDGEPSGEGTLQIGYSSSTPFEGTLNFNFYTGVPDMTMLEFIDEPVFTSDEEMEFTNEGAIHFELNEEDNTVTFTVAEDVYWHDGEPLTIQDYVASYEVIGHPDYDGVRGNTDGFTLIEGFEEYQDGDADEISGIEVLDDDTAVFTYEELAPSLTSGGFWFYAFPEHHYEDVEVEDMSSAPETRENPIGIGPYKVDSIQSGESITLSKFDDYWRGEPQLDGMEVSVIDPSSIANAIESGDIDVAASFPSDQFPDVHDMEGVEWLAQVSNSYAYIGFKLGEWDEDESEVDYKPDEMKMGDPELRRAMWHALDFDAVGEQFFNGLSWKATTLISPIHQSFHNDELDVPDYDPEEANRILDEAGYEDTDDDGFREDLDGEPLEINYLAMSGGDVAEPFANYLMQSWREVGLNVQLVNDRLIEFNSFYDMVESDDPEVDIYEASWDVGSDVNPEQFYGADAAWNYPRYASEENTELLERGNSPEALDKDTRIDIYNEWQELMSTEMPVIPSINSAYVTPVSEDVVNWSEEVGFNEETHLYNVGFSE